MENAIYQYSMERRRDYLQIVWLTMKAILFLNHLNFFIDKLLFQCQKVDGTFVQAHFRTFRFTKLFKHKFCLSLESSELQFDIFLFKEISVRNPVITGCCFTRTVNCINPTHKHSRKVQRDPTKSESHVLLKFTVLLQYLAPLTQLGTQ